MTRFEMVEYLANLTQILEAQEDMGLLRSSKLTREYSKVWEELKEDLTKEQDDEDARKSGQERSGEQENGADPPRNEPRRRITNG